MSSTLVGLDWAVPLFKTLRPAAAQENSTDCFKSFPKDNALAKAPLKQSPAPVVSITFPKFLPGQNVISSPSKTAAPFFQA